MVDTKDWTWVLERPCPECGFAAATLDRSDIGAATRSVAEQFVGLLAGDERVKKRPDPAVWSALEYGCHVRDVFAIMGGRLNLILAEHDPPFANWDQDATAVAERYHDQDPSLVSADLLANGLALADAFDAVRDDQWLRRGFRSDGSVFTVESLGRYMVHDPVHHVWDVEQGLAVLKGASG